MKPRLDQMGLKLLFDWPGFESQMMVFFLFVEKAQLYCWSGLNQAHLVKNQENNTIYK